MTSFGRSSMSTPPVRADAAACADRDRPETCQNCVFWSRHTHYPQRTRLGDCANESFVGTYDIPREFPPGSVFVEIDEGWGFYTDEEFGCIHWLSKEAKP